MKSLLLKCCCTCLFFVFAHGFSFSQGAGVKGTITADDGTVLSFASIYVKQLGSGTTANVDGFYEIPLKPGRYDLVFQHLGKKSEVRVIEVSEGFVVLNITLVSQDIVLQTVTVNADDEDPAYSIMRKTIAKANYHRNVIDAYTARVYVKGSAKLKDYPWLAKKALEKEGVEKGRVYLSESVSDVKFTRPNKFEEKVISFRSDVKDNTTSPTGYIFGSFYEPEIAETVTPLSPKAFSYYKFEYLGTFKDRNYEVSRIKVTPRSKGDNVVDGIIQIVEDWWSIHSLDLHTSKLGVDLFIKITFAPIDEKVWLPVSHQFKVDDKILGFAFEAHYLSSVSDYKVKLNPEIYVENDDIAVVDETKEKQQAAEIAKKQSQKKKDVKTKKLQERLAAGEEITRKELKTIVNEYEKQERKEQKEPEVLSEMNFEIDSSAYKKDSSYWASVRPIPLTREEVKGYEKADSMLAVQKARAEGDTLKKSKHQGFQPWDILIGDSYKIAKRSNFRIHFPMVDFNTVEGVNIVYRLSFGTVFQDTNRTRLTIRPIARYAFAREKLSGYMNVVLRNSKFRVELNGGRYVNQFNSETPILPIVNTFTTLLMEKNLMKIYERDFVDLRYRRVVNQFVTVTTDWSWSERSELFNNTSYKLVNRKSIEDYTPNQPANLELPDTSFPRHSAFVGSVGISARPFLKFRIRNGEKRPIRDSSPAFSISYRKGIDQALGSDVDFDLVELGIKHMFKVGARGTIDFWLRGGKFYNDKKMYFMDYKHFLGNQTPFSTTDPVGSFRLLDYYLFSTSQEYFVANVHYQFRKFLVTNIPQVRMLGIRENVFVNYLATPTADHYTELGYSIDGILRFFRLEAAAAFRDGKYLDYGFRIGVSTSMMVEFSD